MDDESVSRRRMIALGAAGGAALLGTVGATPAPAAPDSTRPPGTLAGSVGADGIGEPRIGSDGISGYSYLHRSWHDFHPFDGGRVWSPEGVYARGPDQWLTSTVDLPSGAVLRDVEWYLTSTLAVGVYAQLWNSGSAFIQTLTGATVPPASSGPRAFRHVVPASSDGQIPLGSKLVLNIQTSSRTRLIGARVGFTA